MKKVLGLLVEVAGFGEELSIGAQVELRPLHSKPVPCEVVGFRDYHALLMPFGSLDGVSLGCPAIIRSGSAFILPDDRWLGRVIDGMARPIDGAGRLPNGAHPMKLRAPPPAAHSRQRIGAQLDLGVRAVNTFLATCRGQRMGIFAGSGVGKSVLLSMMAKYTEAEISVIGLIGERGREVQEFIEDDLGKEGLKRSVVIIATGDEPALMRRQAAYTTLAVAEYFRDQGKQVLLMIDSLTRFAMAQREIGLERRRAADLEGISADDLRRAGAAARARRAGRAGAGLDHRHPLRPRRGRRP